jgi:hypothetical protein
MYVTIATRKKKTTTIAAARFTQVAHAARWFS